MVKLRWLQVNKYRSVKPGTRLVFNASHNVLLGQNGTGKTTLLNLVAAVVESNFSDLWDEEFHLEYQLVYGEEEATATIAVHKRHGAAELKAALDMLSRGAPAQEGGFSPDDLKTPEFSADVELIHHAEKPLSLNMSFRGAHGEVISNKGAEGLEPFQFTCHFGEKQLWANALTGIASGLRKGRSSEQAKNFRSFFTGVQTARFDESLETFNKFREARFYIHRVGGAEWLSGSFPTPDELSDELVESAKRDWGLDQHVVKDERLPFLGKVARLIGFDRAEAVLQLLESSTGMNAERLTLGNLRFLFSRGRERISDQHLSYGQKRMLAFSYYLASTHSVAIADELVNGLHHAWIRACMDGLGQRQVFLTSQNPLLLDSLKFDSAEQVLSTFVLCRKEVADERDQMVWEHMSQEAAEDFFESYKVGFQQVGELLEVKGLW